MQKRHTKESFITIFSSQDFLSQDLREILLQNFDSYIHIICEDRRALKREISLYDPKELIIFSDTLDDINHVYPYCVSQSVIRGKYRLCAQYPNISNVNLEVFKNSIENFKELICS